MKLVTCLYEGTQHVGALTDDGVMFLPYPDMNALIEAGLPAVKGAVSEKTVPLADVTLLAPVPRPRQDVICLGMNYVDHAEESARYNGRAFSKEKPVSVYFSKRVSEAAAPDTEIPSHQGLVERLDYEAELADRKSTRLNSSH